MGVESLWSSSHIFGTFNRWHDLFDVSIDQFSEGMFLFEFIGEVKPLPTLGFFLDRPFFSFLASGKSFVYGGKSISRPNHYSVAMGAVFVRTFLNCSHLFISI